MIIDINTPQKTYEPKNKHGIIFNKKNYKSGQRKLFIMEIMFLTKYSHLSDVVIYAGSAPGHHLGYLIDLFPNITKFYLYDPIETKINSSKFDNKVKICKKYFDVAEALKFKDMNCLFISDIRSFDPESGKHTDIPKADKVIIEDMNLQKQIVEAGNFAMCSLKFRLPWSYELNLEYFDGDLQTQPFTGENSPELRLFTDGKTLTTYNSKRIDDQMFWYNTVKRLEEYGEMKEKGYKNFDSDHHIEYLTVKEYFKKQEIEDEEVISNFIHQKCAKFREKYRY